MNMKLIKRCIVVLMAMIFVTPCCNAGEEIDRLKEAYERKFSKPITQQLEELDGLAQEAIAAGRPLAIAFGTSRMEKDNLILTKYKNPLMVWILDYMMYMPKNREEFSHEYMVTRLRETYEKDMASDQTGATKKNYDELSYDEKVDYCISIISDPCLIAGNILENELYTRLSSRYAGRFDLITTDLGVTEKFDFTYDALSHYTRLLKSGGVMAFDFSHYGINFQWHVHDTFFEVTGIKEMKKYFEEDLKVNFDEWLKGSTSSYSSEERKDIRNRWLALKEELLKTRKEFNSAGFIEKVINKTQSEYLEKYKEDEAGKMKWVPAPFYVVNQSYWPFINVALEEDKQAYQSLTTQFDANNPVEHFKDEMKVLYKSLFDRFFSQGIFMDYIVTMQCGFFPYVIQGRHHTETIDYIAIQRK